MKFSSKIEKCGLSPMRKFAPYAAEAVRKGKKVYHLNIGQPDIATPEAFFDAVRCWPTLRPTAFPKCSAPFRSITAASAPR